MTMAGVSLKGRFLLAQAVGAVGVSVALGVLEASRVILNLGAMQFSRADGLNLFVSSALLNFPLVLFLSLLLAWAIVGVHRRQGRVPGLRQVGASQVGLFLSVGFLFAVGRLLVVTVPLAAALWVALYLIFIKVSRRAFLSLSSGLAVFLIVAAGLWASTLGRVSFDFPPDLKLRRVEGGRRDLPNILLIVLDGVSDFHLSTYGYPRPTSPFLTQLAQEGVRFSRFFASANKTLPSVASILTGLHPSTHGGASDSGLILDERHRLLPEMLKDHGYNTAFFSANGAVDQRAHLTQGSDYEHAAWHAEKLFLAPVQQLFVWLKLTALLPGVEPFLLKLHHLKNDLLADLLGIDSMANARWMNEKLMGYFNYVTLMRDYDPARHKFFVYLHYIETHPASCPRPAQGYCPPAPYDRMFPPDSDNGSVRGKGLNLTYPERQDVARYDGAIRYFDDNLRRTLGFLKERQLLDNTLVIFTSDHGGALPSLRDEIGTRFWEILRVPLILWFPGRLPAGKVVDAPASHVDLVPTLFDLLSLPPPGVVEGTSLLPVIRGELKERTAVGKLSASFKYAVRGSLILIHSGKERSLFDFNSDPLGKRNLYGADEGQTKKMEAFLEEEMERLSRVSLPFVPKKASKKEEEAIREILRKMGYPD